MMNTEIYNQEKFEQALALAKKGTKRLSTNFFVAFSRYASFFKKGILWYATDETCAVFARNEEACTRGFFVCGCEDLKRASELLVPHGNKPLVVDLVGRHQDILTQAKVLEESGFVRHEIILRLTRGKFEGPLQKSPLEVTFAKREDAVQIESLLKGEFDSLADQLPDMEEIVEATSAQNIRVVREDGRVLGFEWNEKTGVTVTMRYGGVAKDARCKGVWSALMLDYFDNSLSCPRHLMWVRSKNTVASACHAHFGYQVDGLEDFVMVKKG